MPLNIYLLKESIATKRKKTDKKDALVGTKMVKNKQYKLKKSPNVHT